MTGSGQLAIPDARKWTGGSPGCPGVVGWPSWMFGSGRENPTNVWKSSGDPTGCAEVLAGPLECPGVVGRTSRMMESDGRPSGYPVVVER